jgi:hypothetical protein
MSVVKEDVSEKGTMFYADCWVFEFYTMAMNVNSTL